MSFVHQDQAPIRDDEAREHRDEKRSSSSSDAEKARADGTIYLFLRVASTHGPLSDELVAEALPEFDDPNIDKDAALAGILGTSTNAIFSPGHSDLNMRRGRLSLPRSQVCSSQYRRPFHSGRDYSLLGPRYNLGYYHPRTSSLLCYSTG